MRRRGWWSVFARRSGLFSAVVIRHVERQERESGSEAALSPEGWSSNSSRSWDDVIRRQFRQHSRLGQAVKALSRCSRWRRTLLSRLATISGDLEWCIAPSFPVICTLSCRVSPQAFFTRDINFTCIVELVCTIVRANASFDCIPSILKQTQNIY